MVEHRSGKHMSSVLPVFLAMPLADSTNRSQHPGSPDVVRNPFLQSPQAAISKWMEWNLLRVKLFFGPQTLGDWRKEVQSIISDFFFNAFEQSEFPLKFSNQHCGIKEEKF